MRKLLNKPWFVGALAATAIALAILRPGQGAGVRDVSPGELASGPSGPGLAPAESFGRPVDVALHSLGPRGAVSDPFARRPARLVVRIATESLRLSAIWTQGGATLILINDSILRAGDKIGSMTVQSATQDGVWMAHGEKRDFLALGETHSFSFPIPEAAAQPNL